MKHEAQSVPEARAMVDSDQSTCFHCGETIGNHEQDGYRGGVLWCYVGRAGQPRKQFVSRRKVNGTSSGNRSRR